MTSEARRYTKGVIATMASIWNGLGKAGGKILKSAANIGGTLVKETGENLAVAAVEGLKTTNKVAKSAIGSKGFLNGTGRGVAAVANNVLGEVGTNARAASNFVGKAVGKLAKKDGVTGVLGYKMTGLGFGLLAVGGTAKNTGQAIGDWNAGRRGQGSPGSVGPAPTYTRAYQQNAGATGDLALGLHKLRRG